MSRIICLLLASFLLTALIPGTCPGKSDAPLHFKLLPDHSAVQDPAKAVDLHGDHLPPFAVQRLGTIRFRSGQMLGRILLSPDDKIVATFLRESILLWDSTSGRLLHRLEHPGAASGYFFTSDGRSIISFTSSSGLQVWDVA